MKVEKAVARRISFRSAAVERAPADLLPRRQVIWKICNYRSSATIHRSRRAIIGDHRKFDLRRQDSGDPSTAHPHRSAIWKMMRGILVPEFDFVAVGIADKSKRLVVTKIAALEQRTTGADDPIDDFIETLRACQA